MTSLNGNISALLALCAGNSPVTGEFPSERLVTWSFDDFFELRLNKQPRRRWIETPSCSLWRRCNGEIDIFTFELHPSISSVIRVVSHIYGLKQERRNSIANALELRLSLTNPSICYIAYVRLCTWLIACTEMSLQWRHDERDGVSNHQPHDRFYSAVYSGLCTRNSPVTGEFPSQRASNAENISIWWRYHANIHEICA